MMTYVRLNKKIRNLGLKINAPDEYYPDLRQSRDLAYPHIEIRFPYFYWVVVERGQELQRKKFIHVDDLLYEVFCDITSNMAIRYEGEHRIEGQDFRRIMFAHRLELISKLSNQWKDKLQQEIDEILKRVPYNDD